MAEVPSTFQLKPGSSAPDFELPDGSGNYHQLSNLIAGKKVNCLSVITGYMNSVIVTPANSIPV